MYGLWNIKNTNIEILEEDRSMLNLRWMSWNNECLPGDKGEMPKPESNPVIQIGIILRDEDLKEEKIILTVGLCEKIENARVLCFQTEREMLIGFRKFVITYEPDLIISYNGDAFDMPYVFNRAKVLELNNFCYFSRLRNHKCQPVKFSFASNAFHETQREDVDIIGLVSIDMLEVFRREQKLIRYTLDHVSDIFLGDRKVKLKISALPELQRSGPKERCLIAKYCIHDAFLPLRLCDFFKTLKNKWMFSQISGCKPRVILVRGQSIKLETLIFSFIQDNASEYIIPDNIKKIIQIIQGLT